MRQNLDELAQWAPTIDEAALRGYVGGGKTASRALSWSWQESEIAEVFYYQYVGF
jgi:hypothetical protein